VRRLEREIVDDQGDETPLMRVLAAAGVPIPPEAVGHGRSHIRVPLTIKGMGIGLLTLAHRTPGFYTEQNTELAFAFAQHAAAAIENARLYEAARGKAALEERQRLARELHDSVSQALYGIVLDASSAEELFEPNPERARALLGHVLTLAEMGLAEMRALIFELRPEALEQDGLVVSFERQVAAVQARHGLAVRTAFAAEPDVPLALKEAMYRIGQEALQNVAKHARASVVDLTLELDGGELVLSVADDGRGFDPDGRFPGHLGLRSMHERAAAVGGVLELASAPGQGTRLRVRVPLTDHA
jgi:signal transduction histidine kinase